MKSERESGEYCLVVLWKRNARVGEIYMYIYERKFSSFHADSLQCVAALHQSRWVHILQPILLSLVPVISLPLSDVAETLGKDVPPRTPSTSFVYTRLRIRNAASYPRRGSTHTHIHVSLSLSFALSFVLSRAIRVHVAFATIGSIVAIGASFLPGTITCACPPSIPARMLFCFPTLFAGKWMRSNR